MAKETSSPWLSVEAETAEEFMYYLAAVLGAHDAVRLTPITDDEDRLQRFSFVSGWSPTDLVLQELRLQVLEDILPGPDRPISVLKIEQFKIKFGDQLKAFRTKIEMELLTLADMQDADLRKRRLDLFKESCQDEISELKARMQESRWPNIVFGRLCAVLAPIPGVGLIPSLLNAAYTALGSGGPKEINSALGYAACVRRHLFNN